MTKRSKFQFSNPTAQAAEARLNAAEALKLVAKWTPKRESDRPETTAAGACFRKVSRHLAGKGEK